MRLQGQHGYAMAALLVSLSVMAILMTAVMPVWKQTAQREKEAELVFRGLQYVHAIQMFQRRSGPGTYPPSFDFLVEQKFLRKKYKDPITNADFVPVPAISPVTPGSVPGAPGTSSTGAPIGNVNALGTPVSSLPTLGPGGSVPGGIAGVVSKSTDKSIRIYNGQTHYNEWVFRALAQAPTPRWRSRGPGRPARRTRSRRTKSAARRRRLRRSRRPARRGPRSRPRRLPGRPSQWLSTAGSRTPDDHLARRADRDHDPAGPRWPWQGTSQSDRPADKTAGAGG